MAGRDRSRSPHGGESPSNEEILDLINHREQARANKDFPSADAIREQLSAIGVSVFDKTHTWKHADGRSGRIPKLGEMQGGALPVTNQASNVGGDEAEMHIKNLVRQREQARANKDFAESDRIRDELVAQGVKFFDKEKMWRTDSGMSGCIIGYDTNLGATDNEIQTLVLQREKARNHNDYATADKIRDELKSVGVLILDRDRMWRREADGRTGPLPNSPGDFGPSARMPPNNFAQGGKGGCAGGGGGGGGVSVDMKRQLVQAALAAAQDPQTAQWTLQMLTGNAPRAPPPPPMPNGGGRRGAPPQRGGGARPGGGPKVVEPPANHSGDTDEILGFIRHSGEMGHVPNDEEIAWVVETREKIRYKKQFGAADEVRNAMANILHIDINQKERCWVASDGRRGAIPSWDQLGLERQ